MFYFLHVLPTQKNSLSKHDLCKRYLSPYSQPHPKQSSIGTTTPNLVTLSWSKNKTNGNPFIRSQFRPCEEESYLSAEMQSVYSVAPNDRAIRYF